MKRKVTLVGNCIFDDEGAVDDNGNSVGDFAPADSIPQIFPLSLCIGYAINEINGYTEEGQSSDENDLDNPIDDDDGGKRSKYRTETTYSNWKSLKQTSNLLSIYKYWTQGVPFNNCYPWRRKLILFGKKRRAPAGCFPLAIAKILTHFEYPDRFIHNGHLIDFKSLKSSNLGFLYDPLSAAGLLHGISMECGSWYFYKGTFTFPHKATAYMRRLGISNAHSTNYNFNRVKEMIDGGNPLIIYSVPGINITESHSWNIDGYKIKQRTATIKKYNGTTLVSTSIKTETCEMPHCDFGQNKCNYNGYYVSGVFKLNDPNREADKFDDPENKTHYNHLIKLITYEKPRN